ncbi:hypothetical protein Lalb_Chr02g0155791 [Lupinus albus]|uniref:Uncharacterized protein n=1 Tax=Lupinus albus TaxID=3870 RepID=A0A6A4R107_LUPAL|nr:hypothetical protein Lalb_Chr02g0155791 [Lupinus albus]
MVDYVAPETVYNLGLFIMFEEVESSHGLKALKPLLLHHTCYQLSFLLVQKNLNIPFIILTLLNPMPALFTLIVKN